MFSITRGCDIGLTPIPYQELCMSTLSDCFLEQGVADEQCGIACMVMDVTGRQLGDVHKVVEIIV